MSLTWNKNLRNRLIIGFSGGAVLLALAFLGGWLFFALILLILLLSLYEMNLMGEKLGYSGFDLFSYLVSASILFDFYLYSGKNLYILSIVFIAYLLTYASVRNKEKQLLEIAFRCLSTFYLSLFLGSLILIRESPFATGYATGGKIIACVFLSIWMLDTFAYFTGKMFGKHKLFPVISPKKTVEGGIGGLAGAIGAVVVAKYIFFQQLPLHHAVIIGLIIGILGQLGDMIESFFKRSTGVKDASSILPGHGGILDRFDSLIFVSPFIYGYVRLILTNL